MIDPTRESRIATGMLGGIIAAVVGVVLVLVGVMGRNGLLMSSGILLAVGGIVSMAVSVGAGLNRVRGDQKTRAVTEARNCRVVARFALNHLGEMLFDIEPQDIDDLKYFVRLQFADGRQGEFKTTWEVFSAAGEGMYGDAAFQGDWLGRFTPQTRLPQA